MRIHIPGKILLDSKAGSHAYGLNTADSDEDYRGVFVADKKSFFSQDFPNEVSDDKNDSSYFELGKFISLLSKNNPTVLEFLNFPEKHIREKDTLFDLITPEMVLSKKCEQSYLGYAMGQIKKAYGFKKRILLPESEEKKTPFHFCHVLNGSELVPFLSSRYVQGLLDVTKIEGEKNLYALHLSSKNNLSFDDNQDLVCGSVEGDFVVHIIYDKAAWKTYRKNFTSYFLWQRDRKRKNLPLDNSLYEGKSLMHTFRLLYTARDIASKGEIVIERPEREKLLRIRNHEFEFNELITEAEDLMDEVRAEFANSTLQDEPQVDKLKEMAFQIRSEVYSEK